MKKRMVGVFLCSVCFLAGFRAIVADGTAATAESDDIIALRQYVQLAQLLATNKGDTNKAEAVISKSVSEVVAKGATFQEKQKLLSEITATLMAAMADCTAAQCSMTAKTIASEALKISPDEPAANVGMVRHAVASAALVTSDNTVLMSMIDSLPENLKKIASDASMDPTSILGGTQSWKIKDLYKAVRNALGDDFEEPEGGVIITMVSTTTTTTTSTTTTTTTMYGSGYEAGTGEGIVVPTTRPRPIPTTRPSPTPVGLR